MKYIIVTGAYGGMGRRTVALLKKHGCCVIAIDRKTDAPEENVIPLQVDITDAQSVKHAFEKVKDVTDEIFAIVHFAGIYMLDSLVEIESDRFAEAFKVNLFGVFLINKTFLPLLKSGSRIVVMTSELAPLNPLPFTGIYAVTKGALDKYAYSLRMELQLLGIYVSVIRAGAVDTGMLSVSADSLDVFCSNTTHYSCNASRFKKIVEQVESKCISPDQIAQKTQKILKEKNPKFVYNINRNPLLLLLNILPSKFQFRVIKQILK